MSILLDFASVCAGGKDKENHDYVGVLEESHCTCFAIADGKNTPDASEIVVNSVMSDFKQQSDITTLTLPAFFEKSQDALISAENDTELPRSCAAAVLLTDGEVAVWAHIGDCRIYHLQDNLLYEITPDHSEAYSRYEAGEIRYPMIRRDRTRRNLYRLMGAKHDFKPEFSAPAVIRKNDCF